MNEPTDAHQLAATLLRETKETSSPPERIHQATHGQWSYRTKRTGPKVDISPLLPILAVLTFGLAVPLWRIAYRRRRTEVRITVNTADGQLRHHTRLDGHHSNEQAIFKAAHHFIADMAGPGALTPEQARLAAEHRRRKRRRKLALIGIAAATTYVIATAVVGSILIG